MALQMQQARIRPFNEGWVWYWTMEYKSGGEEEGWSVGKFGVIPEFQKHVVKRKPAQ